MFKKGGSSSKGKEPVPDSSGVVPHIRLADNSRILPKYTAALARSKDEQIPAEELDFVQLELENLLSNVALRYRVLKNEFDSLEKDEKKGRSKHVEKHPSSPGKRKRNSEIEAATSRKPKVPQFKLAKQKLPTSASSPAQSQHTDDSMDSLPPHFQHQHQSSLNKLLLPKNDIPNKFWLSVEPYCMPLTNEDLKLLDDLMEQYNGELVPPVPELGPHYTNTWAAEDVKEEQDNSNAKNRKNPLGIESDLFKKTEKLMGIGMAGPLTQRLVSALIEENIPLDGLANGSGDSNSCSSENTNTTNSSLKSYPNGIALEKRVRRELIEQGIIDEDGCKSEDDEILSETKRVTTELKAIAEYNHKELKMLHSACEIELERLEIKRKLDAVDHEIIESYKKVVAAKIKRRALTTEEQEDIYRLTSQQKRLSDQLESIPAPKNLSF